MKKIILAHLLLLLTVTLAMRSPAQQPTIIDGIIAIVGKNIVLESELEQQYLQLRMQGGVSGTSESIRCQILENILFQKMMLVQAEIDSVEVTEEMVEQELDRRIRYFVSQIGSQEKLEAYYNKSLTEIKDELRSLISEQMLVEQVQSGLMMKVQVTPSEVKKYFRLLPEDSIPLINTEYEIAQIVKNPPISVDEKIKVKERLRELRSRILQGERFSSLAILYSEDPGSAKNGGELGLYGRGELYPEFEAVAFKLKDGEVSDIVETEAGFHIMQLIERKGQYVNVRHILLIPKVSPEDLEIARQTLDSVAGLINSGQITFDQAVEEFSEGDNKNNGGMLINPYSGGIRFEAEQLDPQVSFVVEKLQVGELSNPVPMKTEDGKDAYRLLMIRQKTEPHRANMSDDYNRITEWALQQKQIETIDQWIDDNIGNTYIKIKGAYSQCSFDHDWIN